MMHAKLLRSRLLYAAAIVSFGIATVFSLQSFRSTESATLRGTVSDAETGEVMPLASIALQQYGVTKSGCSTDFDGHYVMEGLAPGRYRLKVTMVGYEAHLSDEIVLTDGNTTTHNIEMTVGGLELSEVVVVESEVSLDTDAAAPAALYAQPVETMSRSTPKRKIRNKRADGALKPATTTVATAKTESVVTGGVYYDLVSPSAAGSGSTSYIWSAPESKERESATVISAVPAGKAVADDATYATFEVAADKAVDVLSKKDAEVAGAEFSGLKAGTLTAGELHDFSKWELWEDIGSTNLADWQLYWGVTPQNRFSVQLKNEQGWPVIDHAVQLTNETGAIIWQAKTDNTGRAELWADMFGPEPASKYKVTTEANGQPFEIEHARPFHEGLNTLTLPLECGAPNVMDLMFVVDATGSMGDEINYLKTELADVIERVQDAQESTQIRTGSVFYRDYGDEYLVRNTTLSDRIEETTDFIKAQRAGGGGDYPEAVDVALKTALQEGSWSADASTRILFLMLDAPPHHNSPILKSIENSMTEATKMGVRIVPVTGSGIDKRTEYLMRSLALATNGTYAFLTDDSGVGGGHIAPTTDSWDTEKLNDLMVRLIRQFSESPACDDENLVSFKEDPPVGPQQEFGLNQEQGKNALKLFPNPTRGPLSVQVQGEFDEVFLTDMTGKVLNRWVKPADGSTIELSMAEFATGIYFILAKRQDELVSEKVILAR